MHTLAPHPHHPHPPTHTHTQHTCTHTHVPAEKKIESHVVQVIPSPIFTVVLQSFCKLDCTNVWTEEEREEK